MVLVVGMIFLGFWTVRVHILVATEARMLDVIDVLFDVLWVLYNCRRISIRLYIGRELGAIELPSIEAVAVYYIVRYFRRQLARYNFQTRLVKEIPVWLVCDAGRTKSLNRDISKKVFIVLASPDR